MIDQDTLEAKFARIGARMKLTDGSGPPGRRRRPRRPRRAERPQGRVLRGHPPARRRGGCRGARRPALRPPPAADGPGAGRQVQVPLRPRRAALVRRRRPRDRPGRHRPGRQGGAKPAEVRAAQARKGLGAEAGNRRKNAAYRRQGEWFFIPAPDLKVDEKLVLHDEPITRGNGGKPHRCDFCYRTGGETVYVCSRSQRRSEAEYRRLLEEQPEAKYWGWRVMRRNAEVYVRGRVRHADHRTIMLHGWHRVLMNTENQSRAMRNVAFLD